jgi:two-component system response regulator QseB
MIRSRLLIVDDDRDFADGLAEVMEILGHLVDVAFTGRAGVEAAAGNDYDAVVMDVGLPDLNGVDSLLEILEVKPGTRCVLMSGFSAAHVEERADGLGALEILIKPFDPEALSQRISAADRHPPEPCSASER